MIVNEGNIRLVTSSSHDDDGFDCEIWCEKACLIIVSINNEGVVDVIFGKVNDFTFNYDVLKEFLEKAYNIVNERYIDFRKNKI